MAEFSAEEYWLLKEIEENVLESIAPRQLLYYMQDYLGRWKMKEIEEVDIKDLIEFDNVVHKQSH